MCSVTVCMEWYYVGIMVGMCIRTYVVLSEDYFSIWLLPGVVSLSPKETGIIPLKASCHAPSPSNGGSSGESAGQGTRLCFSDVPLGPSAVSGDSLSPNHVCCM